MSTEIETSLLVSLVVLIVIAGCVVWWYGVRKEPSKTSVTFTSPGYRDKLTLIDGIGSTLERKLNALGITSFKQIAELSERDIEKVNEQLAFKGRIEREGWVAQARKLLEAGSRSSAAEEARAPAPRTDQSTTAPSRKVDKKVSKKAAKKKAVSKKKTGSKKTAKKSAKKTARKTAGKTKKKTRTTKP